MSADGNLRAVICWLLYLLLFMHHLSLGLL